MFLLQAWDSYAKSHSVENDRPGVCVCDSLCGILNHFWLSDLFPADQLYVVMATENAGISLENYQVNGHLSGFSYICTLTHTHTHTFSQFSRVEEAVSVLCQVAGALAVGEAVSV